MRRRIAGTVTTLAGLALLAGCSDEIPDFTAAQVADAVAEQIGRSAAAPPSPISCGGLEPEVDARTTCTYVLGDRTQDADVVVSAVDGTEVEFRVDPTRTYLTTTQLTPLVTQELTDEGSTGEVTCLDDLDLELGIRVYCTQTTDAGPVDLAVTARSGATDPVSLQIALDDRDASQNGQ
ncbi:MAG: DUF4333 domain-containing protein [Nocardioides alkalitolerans]